MAFKGLLNWFVSALLLSAPSAAQEPKASGNAPAAIGQTIELRAANKVTGRTEDILVETGVMHRFGQLEINAFSCTKAPPEELPESTAYLQIDELTSEGVRSRIFSGWMFASSPALNALEHPVYDLWVTDCKISDGLDAAESR
ncbi:MAG: DUF2155 domain-containing protein [Pseudomonadota bacterium]